MWVGGGGAYAKDGVKGDEMGGGGRFPNKVKGGELPERGKAWVTHSRISIWDDYRFNPAVTVLYRNNP